MDNTPIIVPTGVPIMISLSPVVNTLPTNTPSPSSGFITASVDIPTSDTKAIPTQTKFPGRAVLRTIFAVLIATVTVINTLLPLVQSAATTNGINAKEAIWLNSLAVGIALIAGIITRIMAIPGVDSLLAKLNLSAAK
jgi:hypothetical protein